MPKRRKAPRRAAAVDSEDEAATEIHEPAARWNAAQQQECDSEKQCRAQQTIDDLEAAVQDKVAALLRMAADAAASMNNELRVQLVKIPKQIRSMRLLEFQEKHAGDLTGPALEEIKSRHQAIATQAAAPHTTGVKGHETVTRTTRKRAAAQPAASDAAAPQRATRARAGRPPRAPVQTLPTVAEDEEEEPDEDQEPAGPSHAASDKSAPKQKVMATPLPGGGVMQTPILPGWKGAQFGGAFATVVKKAGRGAKTNAGNAIVVTCSDGQQVAVDMLNGLSSVPESRRQEVQQQLAQLKSLAEAALR